MSLPLTRRIARAALLVAAGAAPVVGAAGSANAVELGPTQDLGGSLSTVDGVAVGDATDGTAHQAAGLANETGGRVVGTTLPAAAPLGQAARTGAPTAQQMGGQAAGNAAHALGRTTQTAASQGLPSAEALAGEVHDAGATLPAGSLPTDTLPTGQVPATTLPATSLPPTTVPAAPLPATDMPSLTAPMHILPVTDLPAHGLPA
ncbi:ATP-binding protein [Streptomyces sp. NPDC059176]|uniref:ATP-binding protein n=1 Tax=unclassified Streptomyces TaxID=2593676 RepID=UPI00369AAA88